MSWRKRCVYEYRINKKGCECFRSDDREKVLERFKELSEKHPGIYTMQSRSCDYEPGCGYLMHDHLGRPRWSIWA